MKRPIHSALPLLVAGALFITPSVRAELFVTTANGTKVSAYHSLTGAVKDLDFISGLTGTTWGATVAGGDLYVSRSTAIDRFSALTGAAKATPLVSGLAGGLHMAVSGTDLYVVNFSIGTVGKYTTAGATQNASLISGLSGPFFLAVSGPDLYVGNYNNGTIGRYTTSGDVVNASFITGLTQTTGIALHRGKLYVADAGTNEIQVYDAQTGVLISPSFVSGLNSPLPIAIYKERLYVGNSGTGVVGVYDANTGAAINPTFITGVGSIYGLAIRPVPTPTVKITGRKVVKVRRAAHNLKGTGTEVETVRVKVGRAGYKPAIVASDTWSYRAKKLKRGRNRVRVQAVNSEGVSSLLAKGTLVRGGVRSQANKEQRFPSVYVPRPSAFLDKY